MIEAWKYTKLCIEYACMSICYHFVLASKFNTFTIEIETCQGNRQILDRGTNFVRMFVEKKWWSTMKGKSKETFTGDRLVRYVLTLQ